MVSCDGMKFRDQLYATLLEFDGRERVLHARNDRNVADLAGLQNSCCVAACSSDEITERVEMSSVGQPPDGDSELRLRGTAGSTLAAVGFPLFFDHMMTVSSFRNITRKAAVNVKLWRLKN